ncbi:MAG: hypothetical protein J07HN6_00812 [Halonotius sp. J07HN6]|nr:MAG: hypothetical protein J07HN6_00812 [Halonotius sp. J07HN6]
MADVVAVADPRDLHVVEAAELLADRQQVSKGLAGVGVVSEAVDHGHVGVLREDFGVLVIEQPRHDPVDVAAHRAGGVFQRFAVTQLDVVGAHEDRVAAELRHPGLEGDPGARTRLLEEHAERLVGQSGVALAGLQIGRQREQRVEFVGRDIVDIEKIGRIH